VSGVPVAGQTLSVVTGSWSNSPTGYAHAWEDCDTSGNNCTVVPASVSSTYLLGAGDVGHTIRAVVTASNTGGSASATSANTGVVAAAASSAPELVSEPVISGTVATGDVLSTTNGTWTGAPTSYGYQWEDCAPDGTACSDIAGATSNSYTVAASDAGHTIEVVVTAANAVGATSADAPIVPLIDNFTSDSAIDPNVWTEIDQQGDTSNGEVECYEPSQLSVNGTDGLDETEQYVSSGVTCPAGTPDSSNPLFWLSGAVQMRSVNFTYGTVVVRAELAGGDGAWPAIWLLGASCQQPNWLTADGSTGGYNCEWPSDGDDAAETDVAEDLGSDGTSTINENVYSNSTYDACTHNTGANLSSEYHDYEVDWSPGSIVFKIDGTTTSCGLTGANVPSHPMFLIIDTAACTTSSSCGYGTNSATFPQTTKVAWVHISH
jgi:beta-glucanase (GH16 family)